MFEFNPSLSPSALSPGEAASCPPDGGLETEWCLLKRADGDRDPGTTVLGLWGGTCESGTGKWVGSCPDRLSSLGRLWYRHLYMRLVHLEQLGLNSSHWAIQSGHCVPSHCGRDMAYLLPLLLTSHATIPGLLMCSPESESSYLESRQRRIARHIQICWRRSSCGQWRGDWGVLAKVHQRLAFYVSEEKPLGSVLEPSLRLKLLQPPVKYVPVQNQH